jgi:hypothetical protein
MLTFEAHTFPFTALTSFIQSNSLVPVVLNVQRSHVVAVATHEFVPSTTHLVTDYVILDFLTTMYRKEVGTRLYFYSYLPTDIRQANYQK